MITVETWPVDKIIPYDKNAKLHHVEWIAQSISEFSIDQPIVVDGQGVIIKGHGRLKAAKQLGLTEFPVVVRTDLTPEQIRLARIADNRSAEGGWDSALLGEELNALLSSMPDYDFDALGLSEDWFSSLDVTLDTAPAYDDATLDNVPELNEEEEPITKPGDLWQLGKHRLLCGDSTSEADVARLMNGEHAHLCLTDPPYGIGDTASDKNNYDVYDDSKENLITLINKFLPIAKSISSVILITPGNMNHRLYPAPTWTMAWVTPAGTGRGPWGFCCWQPILAYGKDPYLSNGLGSRQDMVNKTESAEKLGHPCSKPIKVWSWLLERGSINKNDIIFDSFGGSGTTLIACESLGRQARLMEISPRYCDLIVKRWETLTGNHAVLL